MTFFAKREWWGYGEAPCAASSSADVTFLRTWTSGAGRTETYKTWAGRSRPVGGGQAIIKTNGHSLWTTYGRGGGKKRETPKTPMDEGDQGGRAKRERETVLQEEPWKAQEAESTCIRDGVVWIKSALALVFIRVFFPKLIWICRLYANSQCTLEISLLRCGMKAE